MKRVAWVVLIAAAFGFALLMLAAVALPLPRPRLPVASEVYDVSGEAVARIFVENRTSVSLEDVPEHLKNAVIAAEDRKFYDHFGVDPTGIARAAVKNLLSGEVVEGGSTITQQLAKNLYLGHERTFSRKAREALLALSLESRFSKDEILEMYLNQVYMGHGIYGVETAASFYFGKRARDLGLAESALLAGIIQSPETLSPRRAPERALKRRDLVLDQMVEHGLADPESAEAAKRETVRLKASDSPRDSTRFFVQHVVDEILSAIPGLTEADLARGGYRIYTTMDGKMQRAADSALRHGLSFAVPDPRGIPQPQGALVAIDPSNGHIRALVGGTDYDLSSWNRATKARRQPGSAFKPFLYYGVLSRGYPPTSYQVCEPVSFPGSDPSRPYVPKDFGEDYHYRPIRIREAVKISDNVAAVKWAHQVGPGVIADNAKKAGIESPMDVNLTLALGTSAVTPLEMAVAYSPFANGGFRVRPIALLKLVDSRGRTLLENRAHPPRKVFDERFVYMLTDIMKSVLEPGGTGSGLRAGRPCAGKSGTSDDYKDLWFIGYSPDIVAAVYVGNDDQRISTGRTGGAVAGPIWASFMREALAKKPLRDFPRPPGVVKAEVCAETGFLASPGCPSYSEAFLAGAEPSAHCPRWHLWPFVDEDLSSEGREHREMTERTRVPVP